LKIPVFHTPTSLRGQKICRVSKNTAHDKKHEILAKPGVGAHSGAVLGILLIVKDAHIDVIKNRIPVQFVF
jgi:hypothetical protein